MIVMSIIAYSLSASTANRARMEVQTPRLAQRLCRRCVLFQSPRHSGRSRHGMPIRQRYRTAFTKRRLSAAVTPVSGPLLDHVAALSDPRQHAKVLYPLPEILLLVLSSTIAGADDFVETTLRGAEHLAYLRRFYPYDKGIPSHDTLCDVFAALDPELFKSCFLSWISGLRDDDPDIIAIDGKTSRRSHDRRKGRNPLHLVSAWAARQRIVLGQQATEEKSNEITAIPMLLKHLDLKGALVTMDAMGTQIDIARAIRDGGGDYCMSLKKNWPAVYAEVEQLFTDPPDDVTFETKETVDLTAGRIETRRHTVCHKVDWMTSDRHYPGEPVFPDLAMIGRIRNRGRANGKIEQETRYYLCSLALHP